MDHYGYAYPNAGPGYVGGYGYPHHYHHYRAVNPFVLIVVLFILLIIVGAAYIR